MRIKFEGAQAKAISLFNHCSASISIGVRQAGSTAQKAAKQGWDTTVSLSSSTWKTSMSGAEWGRRKSIHASKKTWHFSKVGASKCAHLAERIRLYLESDEFESNLDQLIKRRLNTEEFAKQRLDVGSRKNRIHSKLKFLRVQYGKEIVFAAALGDGIGKKLGRPDVGTKLAMVLGGIQVTFIVGEITYIFIFNERFEPLLVPV